jgi:RHS repeat-associated protein
MSGGTFNGTTVTYKYDPAGGLKSRVTASPASTTNYLLGDLFETNGSGAVTTSYVAGPAGDLVAFGGPPTSTSTVTYLYYSGHGDLAAEANSAGVMTATHSYDAFGTPIDSAPANSTSHRYVGRWDKQFDSEDALVLMGARPYDPGLGRFLAVDPVDGGSLNNYDYAGQDPINGYDLDGTRPVAEPDNCALRVAACTPIVQNPPSGRGVTVGGAIRAAVTAAVASGKAALRVDKAVAGTPLGKAFLDAAAGKLTIDDVSAIWEAGKRCIEVGVIGAGIGLATVIGAPEGAIGGCVVGVALSQVADGQGLAPLDDLPGALSWRGPH